MTHQQDVAARLAQLRREKSARDRRDIGQKELADVIGATPETYSRYENARRKVPDEAILALAKFYGVSPAYIRYGVADTVLVGGLEIEGVERISSETLQEARRLVAERRATAAREPETAPRPGPPALPAAANGPPTKRRRRP